jgi:hypothetical protein
MRGVTHDINGLILLRDYSKEIGVPNMSLQDLIDSHRRMRTSTTKIIREDAVAMEKVYRDGYHKCQIDKIESTLKSKTVGELFPDLFGE